MVTGAVVSFLVGSSLVVAGVTGDFLTGAGTLLLGVAAVMTGWAAMSSRKARANTEAIASAVGPPNGTTVLALLQEIKGFESYQHTRNHEVLNHLAGFKLALPTLIDLCQQLLDELRRERDD